MATSASKSALRDALEEALSAELKRVTNGTDPDTSKKYTLTDKSKVWDRVLKLEAIKAKLNEGQWGAGFSESGGDED